MSSKAELWRAVQWEGSYTWMVYDYERMECYWFVDEDAARGFLKALRAGTSTRRPASSVAADQGEK